MVHTQSRTPIFIFHGYAGLLLTLMLLWPIATNQHNANYYISATKGNINNSGFTLDNALPSVKSVLDKYGTSNITIINIDEGVYEGFDNLGLLLNDNVILNGLNGPNKTDVIKVKTCWMEFGRGWKVSNISIVNCDVAFIASPNRNIYISNTQFINNDKAIIFNRSNEVTINSNNSNNNLLTRKYNNITITKCTFNANKMDLLIYGQTKLVNNTIVSITYSSFNGTNNAISESINKYERALQVIDAKLHMYATEFSYYDSSFYINQKTIIERCNFEYINTPIIDVDESYLDANNNIVNSQIDISFLACNFNYGNNVTLFNLINNAPAMVIKSSAFQFNHNVPQTTANNGIAIMKLTNSSASIDTTVVMQSVANSVISLNGYSEVYLLAVTFSNNNFNSTITNQQPSSIIECNDMSRVRLSIVKFVGNKVSNDVRCSASCLMWLSSTTQFDTPVRCPIATNN